MRHEDYKELLELEAAGAVDPSELRAVDPSELRALDAHLAACAECRAEFDALREAAAALAYTVAPVAPPAQLRARVLEQVRELKTTTTTTAVVEKPRASSVAEEARRLLRSLSLWQILGARPALGFGAAALVVLLAALAALSFTLWGRTREMSAEIARLTSRLGESEEQTAAARGQLARMQEVNEIMTAPGARLASLAGTKTAPQARAHVAYDRATGRVLLFASELPPAPAGKAYQLWFIAEGRPAPMPGGVFKTDDRGRGQLNDRLPADAPGLDNFAVTLEDERGVQTPAGAMYLLGAAS